MIIGELRRYLRDNNSIRVSRSLRDIAYKALRMRDQIINTTGNEPSPDELAKLLEVKKDELVLALNAVSEPVSLFDPIYTDGTDTVCIMDSVSDETSCDELWLEHIALNEAMEKLSEREQRILNLRFFRGKTQNEVSDEIGISQAQVSRLEKSALARIRKSIQP